MLRVRDLVVRYGPIEAVHGIDLHVDTGEVVALVGPNGAGKTSTVHAIASVVRAERGSIELDGIDIARSTPERVVRAGVATVPEGRRIFGSLTVRENLHVALAARRDRRSGLQVIEGLLDRLPILRSFADRAAGLLSGGQQQQLAIARALVTQPKVLMLDEPSLGLAPQLVDTVFELVTELRDEGTTVLLVEQNAARAIGLADRSYIMRNGSVVRYGTRDELLREDIADLFLGGTEPVAS